MPTRERAAIDKRGRIHASFRLDRDLVARLRSEAADRDVSSSVLVARAVADYLDRLLPLDQVVLTRDKEAP